MMFRFASLVALFFLVVSVSLVSAQWVETPVFVEVTSEQAGSEAQGCAVANIAGMIASLENPKIGSNPAPIIEGIRKGLCPPDQWPPQPYDLYAALLNFLARVL